MTNLKKFFSVLLLIVIGSIGSLSFRNVNTYASTKHSWSWSNSGAFSWKVKVYECKKPLNPTTKKLGGLCFEAYWAWK